MKNRLAMCAVAAACVLPLGMQTAMAAPPTPSDTKVEYCKSTQAKVEAEIHARLLKIGLHRHDADRITVKISHEISHDKAISADRIRELTEDDVTPAQKDKLAEVISNLPGHRIARAIADHNKKVLDDIDKVIIDKLVDNGVDERTAEIVAPHVTGEIVSKHAWNADTVKDGLDKGFDEAAKHNAEVGDKAAKAMDKGVKSPLSEECNAILHGDDTPSADPSGSASPSASESPSVDPSESASPTATSTADPTPSESDSPTADASDSATIKPDPEPTDPWIPGDGDETATPSADPSVTPTATDSPEPSESADDENTGDEGVLPVVPSTNPSSNTGDEGVVPGGKETPNANQSENTGDEATVTGPATPSADSSATAAPAGGGSDAKALPKTGN